MDVCDSTSLEYNPNVEDIAIEEISDAADKEATEDKKMEVDKELEEFRTIENIETKSTNENSAVLKCSNCDVEQCVMWRKLDPEKLLCNICHLSRVKSVQSGLKNNSSSSNVKGKEVQAIRISSRKNKSKKKFTNNGVYGERTIKNGNNKNRRNNFKKKPVKCSEQQASVLTSKYVYYNVSAFITMLVCVLVIQ